MKRLSLVGLLLLFAYSCFAQLRIDDEFQFQTDPAKKYSIYVPSAYDLNSPNELILALHPFNTARWNAVSWCDTLIDFAEDNNVLLIVPDGGPDGKVDDPIDTAFTSVVLDSMLQWYNVDQEKIYVMGFSWGGLTSYTYGLSHADRFAGFIPIGAAINGAAPVGGVIQNAKEKPFYLIHGSNDNLALRFTPLLNALENAGACVNSNVLNGVGHTIDFENRNQIITDALDWIRSINCGISALDDRKNQAALKIYPNPIGRHQNLNVEGDIKGISQFKLLSYEGRILMVANDLSQLKTSDLNRGVYWIIVTDNSKKTSSSKFVVY